MKKLFLASIALIALDLGKPTAFAAELAVPAYAPPPVPVYTWSGCYVGANAGTNSGQSRATSQDGCATETYEKVETAR